jgi:hypothetical protein
MDGEAYLADVRSRFRGIKDNYDRALAQVPFERWSHRLDPGSNSLVTILLHVSGNMISRWSDFLTSDGEKPGRDRDTEFEDSTISHAGLMERWEHGWATLFGALDGLKDADLSRTIHIRAEPLPVVHAIHRQLAHYAYHAGQVVFLAKHLSGESWRTLSVPRHGSAELNARMMGPAARGTGAAR